MKKQLSILFLCLSTFFVQAQTTKTKTTSIYGGGSGTATYSYYVDSLGREIKHGQFKFVEQKTENGATYNRTISGVYKHNFFDGAWTHTITKVDVPDGNMWYTGNIKFIKTFKDGIPNGPWTYNSSMKRRGKTWTQTSVIWKPFETLIPDNISVNFTDGLLTGKVTFITSTNKFESTIEELPNIFIGSITYYGNDYYGFYGGTNNPHPAVKNTELNDLITQIIEPTYYENKDDIYVLYHYEKMSQQKADFLAANKIKLTYKKYDQIFKMLNDGYFNHSIWLTNSNSIPGDKTILTDQHGRTVDQKYGVYVYMSED